MKTRRHRAYCTLAILIAMFIAFSATPAMAEDVILETTVDSVTLTNDKNGNPYVRVIISEIRTLNGMEYTATVPVMFFGDTATDQVKALAKGDQVKILVNKRIYQGNHSYTARKLLPLGT